MGKKTISLVLSSGGARGMAHIGAIEALEERGYEIVAIAGSSAGALVGGIYASGQLENFKDWITNLDRIDVFSLMDFTFPSRGFIKGIKVFQEMKKFVKDCQIEDLKIPFVCNAVEVNTGQETIFNSGSLFDAIRASSSIPTILNPALVQEVEYIDGGILNPIPLNLCCAVKDSLLVAVDANGPKEAYVELLINAKTDEERLIKMPMWMIEYREKFGKLFGSQEKEIKTKNLGPIDLMNHSFDLIQDKLSALIIAQHKIDILVEISRIQAGTLEFHKAADLIEIGKQKMYQAIDQFENGHPKS
jgi:NTE family protein